MTEQDWVCIAKARGHLEGEIYRIKLEAYGIPVQTFQESAGQTYGLTIGSLGEVTIWVPASQETQARQLLAEADDPDPSSL